MQQYRTIGDGRLSAEVMAAQARSLRFDGVEILRGLSAPIRDANWGTFPLMMDEEVVDGGRYACRFTGPDRLFSGEIRIAIESERRCTADFILHLNRDAELNRAGFCLLHPIRGVAGSPMTVLRSDGTVHEAAFPETISPGQTAFDMAGLIHRIGPLTLRIAMDGEVFEMEDQRNWSDASFKTYCRPLSRPYPFTVQAGEVLRQRVTLDIISVGHGAIEESALVEHAAILPSPYLAYNAEPRVPLVLAQFPSIPLLVRIDSGTNPEVLKRLAEAHEIALELVFDDPSEIEAIAERCKALQLRPNRVIALPRTYLKSHQPQGPWPAGPTPGDAVAVLRTAFPEVAVGGGSLTNFTEFNRCRPGTDVNFLTFGNTAIVHAADDLSVVQTLEALPDMFASAKRLRPDLPLHLGLFSIGMRSNPYGADVQANPSGKPTPMARWDRRQETEFAAAYAVGVLAQAALAGVRSIALAMPDGELGAAGRPIREVIMFAQRHAGEQVRIRLDRNRYTISADGEEMVGDFSNSPSEGSSGTLGITVPEEVQVLERSR